MNINKVFIGGSVGIVGDPKQTESGLRIQEFSVEVVDRRTFNGQERETRHFQWITCFGDVIIPIATNDTVFVEGKLKTNAWEDKNTGEKKYKTIVIASKMEKIQLQPKPQDPPKTPDYPEATIDPDAIPF